MAQTRTIHTLLDSRGWFFWNADERRGPFPTRESFRDGLRQFFGEQRRSVLRRGINQAELRRAMKRIENQQRKVFRRLFAGVDS